jgi:hypothetical protein
MHKSIDQTKDIYIYMKNDDKVYGVLSSHLFHEVDRNKIFFNTAMFTDEKDLGLPPFFDVIFVSKSDEEVVVQAYEDCYVLEYRRIMRCDGVNVMQDVSIYYKDKVFLGINRDIE